jgi:hypothetical protein
MESPLAVLSAAAHYVEQMEQLKLSASVGASLMPPVSSVASVHSPPVVPPVTLLVPCANGLLVPYVQQPGPYYYNFAGGPLVPPNKLALSPLSPASSLSSPHGSLGSSVSSTVSTPTEERHILLPRISHEELHQKLRTYQASPIPASTTPTTNTTTTEVGNQTFTTTTTAVSPKVVLRRKKPIPSTENIQQSVENHFRRSLGSNYKDAAISQQATATPAGSTPPPPPLGDPIVKPKGNIRRRPHSIFVSEEVDRHFERSLGVEAWQVIQAKRAKLARKTWN